MSDTPRTELMVERAPIGLRTNVAFEQSCDLCRQLERELNEANVEIEEKRKDVVYLATEKAKLEDRIKRLEAELERTKQERNAIAKNTREPLLLQLDHANDRIKRLEEAYSASEALHTVRDCACCDSPDVWIRCGTCCDKIKRYHTSKANLNRTEEAKEDNT